MDLATGTQRRNPDRLHGEFRPCGERMNKTLMPNCLLVKTRSGDEYLLDTRHANSRQSGRARCYQPALTPADQRRDPDPFPSAASNAWAAAADAACSASSYSTLAAERPKLPWQGIRILRSAVCSHKSSPIKGLMHARADLGQSFPDLSE